MTNRRLYPDNWEELARACKEAAGWKCEQCQMPHLSLATSTRTGNPYIVYLHACHVNHDQRNPEPVLKCLCPACHSRLDYQHHERQMRVRLEKLRHALLLARRGVDLTFYGG
jgi:ssDNA-binding Zn-finger/Zn-ribbon topoisomerase 1